MSPDKSPNSQLPSIFCPTCGTPLDSELVEDLAAGITIYCASCGEKFDYDHYKHRFRDFKSRVGKIPSSQHKSTEISQPIPYSPSAAKIHDQNTPSTPSLAIQPSSQTNRRSSYTSSPDSMKSANELPEYHQFQALQKRIKKEYQRAHKINKNIFSEPQKRSKIEYKQIIKQINQSFKQAEQENKRIYQLTMLTMIGANPSDIKNIKKNYKRLRKRNKRQYSHAKRNYTKSYNRVRDTNKKLYQTVEKTNKANFQKIIEMNENQWKKFALTLNPQFLEYWTFTPTMLNPEEFRLFDPNIFTPPTPELFKTSENSKNQEVLPYLPQSSPHLKSKLKSNIPVVPRSSVKTPPHVVPKKRPARFDPFTGKPLPHVKRFDPFTGKPITPEESGSVTTQKPVDTLEKERDLQVTTIKSPEKVSIAPEITENSINTEIKEPEKSEITSEFPPVDFDFSQIYTVLEPDVREKLLDLPISEEDRDLIAKSFIYLNHSQQLKYLDELSAVNTPDTETREKLCKSIQKLPIPENQKQFLINQLEYLNPTEQNEFVSTLEQSANGTIEKIDEKSKSDLSEGEDDIKSTQTPISETSNETAELKPEEAEKQKDDEEIFKLQEERDRLMELKQKRMEEEKLKREMAERQRLEEERLERVKQLKEKVKSMKKESKSSQTSKKSKKKQLKE